MSFVIQRFDSVGLQVAFSANGSGGAVVNVFGSSAPNPNRLGVVIFNPSASDALAVRIAPPSANATAAAALPIFAVVPPQSEKFIAANGTLAVWARSLTTNTIASAGAHEVK